MARVTPKLLVNPGNDERVLVLVDQAGRDKDAAVAVVRPAAGEGLERVQERWPSREAGAAW
jgi:hypothetical protein